MRIRNSLCKIFFETSPFLHLEKEIIIITNQT